MSRELSDRFFEVIRAAIVASCVTGQHPKIDRVLILVREIAAVLNACSDHDNLRKLARCIDEARTEISLRVRWKEVESTAAEAFAALVEIGISAHTVCDVQASTLASGDWPAGRDGVPRDFLAELEELMPKCGTCYDRGVCPDCGGDENVAPICETCNKTGACPATDNHRKDDKI